jgi:hypothetical protein
MTTIALQVSRANSTFLELSRDTVTGFIVRWFSLGALPVGL